MTTILHPVSCLAAALVIVPAFWGLPPLDLAAQSAAPQVVIVNGDEITNDQIERRARFLTLYADIAAQAKKSYQELIKDEGPGG